MTSDDIIAFLRRAKAAGYVDPQLSFTVHAGDGIDLRFEGVKGDRIHGHNRSIRMALVESARFDVLKKELQLIENSLDLRAPLGLVPEESR